MPYVDRIKQLNIKLTPAEYELLDAEAYLATVSVAQYARHLLLARGEQPLAMEAEHLMGEYVEREDALREKLQQVQDQLWAKTQEAATYQQQVQTLAQELAEWKDPARLQQLFRQALEQKGE
ncbi:hypothetical protein PK28_16675 (plasmid) [Hymenobacter sp. DG25B]|uniref:plasmid mobilization protein n=1 Tax=Hymenobacter sp. DG25B TaxID=1385664 RepID=UPI0005406ECC|nr:hypothetical protein [Hymenobacter sp. DG25B]AIZ65331.1 hypothetical protein PK28_16675 [Hymenobacter sp. DG25B]